MIHCTSYNCSKKIAYDLDIGCWVQSTFRARWIGILVRVNKTGGIATVKVLYTKRGGKQRKPFFKELHCSRLKRICPKDYGIEI